MRSSSVGQSRASTDASKNALGLRVAERYPRRVVPSADADCGRAPSPSPAAWQRPCASCRRRVGRRVAAQGRTRGPTALGRDAEPARQPCSGGSRAGSGMPRAKLVIAVVAGEQFVAAIARQRHRDVLARQRGDEIGRDLRGIGERLVIDSGSRGITVSASSGVTIELGVVGAEMRGDGRAHAAPRRSPSRGSRSRRSRTGRAMRACISADDGRGIDAARQERAERHVGHHPHADRIAQQRVELLRRPRRRCRRSGAPAASGDGARVQ